MPEDPFAAIAKPVTQGDPFASIAQPVGAATATAEPPKPSTYERLTAGYDPGAAEFDERHPVLGKGVRAFSALGGAVMALPGSIYHAAADPLTPDEEKE